MITSALILLAGAWISGLILILPAGTSPVIFQEIFEFFYSSLSLIPFFPVDTLFTIVGLTIGIEIAIFLFKFARWFLSKLPFIGK